MALHIGMRKTGSTALQRAFKDYENREALSVKLHGQENLSGPLMELFRSDQKHYVGLALSSGKVRQRFDAHRTEKELDAQILDARGRKLIVSCETLSNKLGKAHVRDMRDWFAKRKTRVHCLAYVRPPASLAQSEFRQGLLTEGKARFEPRIIDYQHRIFSKFFRFFGEQNVHIRSYRTPDLKNGDIVRDFSGWIGVPAPETVRTNISRSLPTLALIYAFDHFIRDHSSDERAIKIAKKWLSTSEGGNVHATPAFLRTPTSGLAN